MIFSRQRVTSALKYRLKRLVRMIIPAHFRKRIKLYYRRFRSVFKAFMGYEVSCRLVQFSNVALCGFPMLFWEEVLRKEASSSKADCFFSHLVLAEIGISSGNIQPELEVTKIELCRPKFRRHMFREACRYAELLTRLGKVPELSALVEETSGKFGKTVQHEAMKSNLKLLSGSGSHREFFHVLKNLYEELGLAPVELLDQKSSSIFFDLESKAPKVKNPTKKISVLMPAYNCEDTIGFAIESVLRQSWSNLELLIVDDFSSDNTRGIISSYAAKDPRIRTLHNSKNQGAYRSRNTALDIAQGDFVTVHDTDDWSHPQKFELQMRHQNSENLTWTMGICLTTSPPYLFRNMLGSSSIMKRNYSSLMSPISFFKKYGNWDEVRVGADSELVERFCRAVDLASPELVLASLPMTFLGFRENSLTKLKATSAFSISHGLRKEYISSFRAWHQSEQTVQDRSICVDGRKPFPIPLPSRLEGGADFYDKIIVANFDSKRDDILEAIENIMEKTAAEGGRNGIYRVIEIDDFSPQRNSRISFRIFKDNYTPIVDPEKVACGVLIFLNTRYQKFCPTSAVNIVADSIEIIDLEKSTLAGGEEILKNIIRVDNNL